jgi:hypothetical protein
MPYSRMFAALQIARSRGVAPRQFDLSWDDFKEFTAGTHGLQSVSGYPQTWTFAGVHVRLSVDGAELPLELNEVSRTAYRYVPGQLHS